MCSGTIGMTMTSLGTLASGCFVVMTTVESLGALTVLNPLTREPFEVPAAVLCMIRFRVHAASLAVSGTPSLHFRPVRRWKVQLSLFDETDQDVASHGPGRFFSLPNVRVG